MTTAFQDWPAAQTEYGMLVALGEFVQQHGLIEGLMQVPIPQKTRQFTPQTKLVEFLAGIQSGVEPLEDLNDGPHPLVRGNVVARTWGQAGFAHYGGVSRTLDVCTPETVRAVEQAVTDFSQPFIAAHLTPKWLRTLSSPKHVVQVAANCTARVEQTRAGTALQFVPDSPFPGVILVLKGVPAFQLDLGFNRPC
jgi:hypothetical protein